ncbi:unnamed protein product, partial [Polarella glacialis]
KKKKNHNNRSNFNNNNNNDHSNFNNSNFNNNNHSMSNAPPPTDLPRLLGRSLAEAWPFVPEEKPAGANANAPEKLLPVVKEGRRDKKAKVRPDDTAARELPDCAAGQAAEVRVDDADDWDLPACIAGQVVYVVHIARDQQENGEQSLVGGRFLASSHELILHENKQWLRKDLLEYMVSAIDEVCDACQLDTPDPPDRTLSVGFPLCLCSLVFTCLIGFPITLLVSRDPTQEFLKGLIGVAAVASFLLVLNCLCQRSAYSNHNNAQDPQAVLQSRMADWSKETGLDLTFHRRKVGGPSFFLLLPSRKQRLEKSVRKLFCIIETV